MRLPVFFLSSAPAIFGAILALFVSLPAPAQAAGAKAAIFSGLDKITAEISTIEAVVDTQVEFGTLEILVRQCNKRPPEEPPEIAAFVEITEQLIGEEAAKPLFTGWMFASSPGLNALEHPVYDVWLTDCKTASGGASGGSR